MIYGYLKWDLALFALNIVRRLEQHTSPTSRACTLQCAWAGTLVHT